MTRNFVYDIVFTNMTGKKRRSSHENKFSVQLFGKNNKFPRSSCSTVIDVLQHDNNNIISNDSSAETILETYPEDPTVVNHNLQNEMVHALQENVSEKNNNIRKRRKSEIDSLYDDLPFLLGYAGRKDSSVKCESPLKDTYLRQVAGSNVNLDKRSNSQTKPFFSKGNVELKKDPKKVSTIKSKKLKFGDLVIGDIKSFGWWYGKIVKHDKKNSAKHLVWVHWFGDNKTLEFPLNYLKSYHEFPEVFNPMKMKKRLYRTAVEEFIGEIQSLYSFLKLPLPDMKNVSKSKEFSEWLKWAKNGFVKSIAHPCSDNIVVDGRSSQKERPKEVVKISSTKAKIVSRDGTKELLMEQYTTKESHGDSRKDAEEDLLIRTTSATHVCTIEQSIEHNVNNNEESAEHSPYTNNVPTVEKDLDSTMISNSAKNTKESHTKQQNKATPNCPVHFIIKDVRLENSNTTIIHHNVNTNSIGDHCNLPNKKNEDNCEKVNSIVKEEAKLFNDVLIQVEDCCMPIPVTSDDILPQQNTDGTNHSQFQTPVENGDVNGENDFQDDLGIPLSPVKSDRLQTPGNSMNNYVSNKKNLYASSSHGNKTTDSPEKKSSFLNVDSSQPDDYVVDARSESTIFFDANEENVHPNFAAPRLRKKKGGINLDVNLIGTHPSKRHSSAKAEDALKSKKHKKGDSSVDNRKRSSGKPAAVDHLPVETSRSKVLSWNIYTKHFVPEQPISFENNIIENAMNIKINDLIIGKLKGFDWWFGKVISHKEAHKHRPPEGMCWVYWYGDHKLSQMPIAALELLDKFCLRFLHKKMRGSYMTAVDEVLNEAAFRSDKSNLPDRFDDGQTRLKVLVKWALGGFQPMRLSGFRGNESVSDDVASTVNDVSVDWGIRPRLNKDVKVMFDKVAEGFACIEDLCLACGDTSVVVPHPIFEGGLCKECKVSFLECAYLYDDNGSQMYCCICSDGHHIICCDNAGCSRSYCPVCIDTMCGVGYTEKISLQTHWRCFMCSNENVRLLKIRMDWQERMKEIFNEDEIQMDFAAQIYFDPIPRDQRQPIRVLGLFDGIATACFVLKKLNLKVGVYVASEIDPDATKVSRVHHGETIKYVGDVRQISKGDIEKWGPFDLVIGGSPCNDLSVANPSRKGVYEGTGRLFFEFFRLLQYAAPTPLESRPFFWLFENVVGMRQSDKEVICRFLQCNPVVVNAKDLSAQHRSRYFWGNIPGMNRPSCNLDSSNLKLQDCLEENCGRTAKFDKVGCITTMRHSLRQTRTSTLPVQVDNCLDEQDEDELWLTEIERIFGFPEHYTDVGNMGQRQRQRLLGKSWSVPVIEHLLMPLKDYFKLNDAPPLMIKSVSKDNQTQTSFEDMVADDTYLPRQPKC